MIGDSQIKLINPRKTFKSKYCSKICVPGITAKDLYYWLQSQNTQNGVVKLVLHVGINDCVQGNHIKEQHWTQVIESAKRVFPGSDIFMSTMMPVGTRDKLHHIVDKSISNLEKACTSCEVTIINHSDIFLTQNGAPRMSLLENKLHPNFQGSIKIAFNVRKYAMSYYDDHSQNNQNQTLSDKRFTYPKFNEHFSTEDKNSYLNIQHEDEPLAKNRESKDFDDSNSNWKNTYPQSAYPYKLFRKSVVDKNAEVFTIVKDKFQQMKKLFFSR